MNDFYAEFVLVCASEWVGCIVHQNFLIEEAYFQRMVYAKDLLDQFVLHLIIICYFYIVILLTITCLAFFIILLWNKNTILFLYFLT